MYHLSTFLNEIFKQHTVTEFQEEKKLIKVLRFANLCCKN